MGNANSHDEGRVPHHGTTHPHVAAVRNFLKTSVAQVHFAHTSHHNAIGISKAELDERCRPSGLYPKCLWEEKTIRRLIGDGKLAARLRGTEDRTTGQDRECPICFLHYSEINVTKCCHANLCTECYLQVQPQKGSKSNNNGPVTKQLLNHCPFCNHPKLAVTVAGQVVESLSSELVESAPSPVPESSPTTGFGSSLEQNDRVALMRARSSSLSESASVHSNVGVQIASLAIAPAERQSLEEEMRAQHQHPLTLRLEQEEAERRLRNELEYYQRASVTQRRTIRDVRHTINHGHGEPVFRESRSGSAVGGARLGMRGMSEEEQIALAIEASLRDSIAAAEANESSPSE